MALLFGLFLGIVVGIVLVFGWNYAILRRSKHRQSKAQSLSFLSRMGQDDARKLLTGNFPPWIMFPEFERVKWLNRQLERVWPSVAEAAADVIRQSVEPVLEEYRPAGISSLKFSKLFLGHVAPQIEGIRMQTLKPGQLIMDIDFRWNGDASIILGIRTLVGAKLPVQLKNLRFFATVRVIFQLCDALPCISGVVVALLPKPKPEVKYNFKVVGGSVSAVPGLADMIKETVDGAISDQLEWPHRIIVPIGGIPVDLSDLELKLQGRVTVTVLKATSLKNKELIGKSDPYVVLFVRLLFKLKTRTISNNLNPEWNEVFELDVEDLETQHLVLQVYDEDIGQKDTMLGAVSFLLKKLKPEEETEYVLDLLPSLDTQNVRDKKDRGSIAVKLKYHPYTNEEATEAMEKEKKFLEEKHKAKEAGMIGTTMEAVGGAVGGAAKVGINAVDSGLGKAKKFVTASFGGGSRRVKSPAQENGVVRRDDVPISKWFAYLKGKRS